MTDYTHAIPAVEKLQTLCAIVCAAVMQAVRAGMSETDLADEVLSQFSKHGINEHWYDNPVIALFGPDRFEIGTTVPDYTLKGPQADSFLEDGMAVHLDFAPVDPETGWWGDWSTTFVFNPSSDSEEPAFLNECRGLQREGIAAITANTSGADVAQFFLDEFAKRNVALLDVRKNVGHSIHRGLKKDANRIWLDLENTEPLGEGIFTIEPGGRSSESGKESLVARFEECIYIPASGPARILGNGPTAPLVVLSLRP